MRRLLVGFSAVFGLTILASSPAAALSETIWYWNVNLNNVSRNSHSLSKPFSEDSMNHFYQSGPAKATEVAFITCGSSWGFITNYIQIGAYDTNNYYLGSSTVTCYRARARTPNSSSWTYVESRPNSNDF